VKSYQDLAVLLSTGGLKNPRSAVLAAYALNGFAHFASLAVFVGGTAALVPKRTKDISAIGFRALIARNTCLPHDRSRGRDLFYAGVNTTGEMICIFRDAVDA